MAMWVSMARNLLTGPGAQRLRVLALTSQAERVGSLRAQGVTPLVEYRRVAFWRSLFALSLQVQHELAFAHQI